MGKGHRPAVQWRHLQIALEHEKMLNFMGAKQIRLHLVAGKVKQVSVVPEGRNMRLMILVRLEISAASAEGRWVRWCLFLSYFLKRPIVLM